MECLFFSPWPWCYYLNIFHKLYAAILSWASQVTQVVKNPFAKQEMWVQSLEWGHSLEKEMATHYRILAWGIPYREEPDGLQSMGPQRLRNHWARTYMLQFYLHTHYIAIISPSCFFFFFPILFSQENRSTYQCIYMHLISMPFRHRFYKTKTNNFDFQSCTITQVTFWKFLMCSFAFLKKVTFALCTQCMSWGKW